MGSISIWHWLIVLLVVVLIFGTRKLRNIGSDLGGAVRGFKEGMRDANDKPQSDATEIPSTTTGRTIEGEANKEAPKA